MSAESETQLVISYVPLLWPDESSNGEVLTRIKGLPTGEALGCAWTERDGRRTAILVMDQGDEIAEHFEFWSEGKASDWFRCHWTIKDKTYALALVPETSMTMERFRIQFQLRTGYPFPSDRSTQIVFRFLHFVAEGRSEFVLAQDDIDIRVLDKKNVEETWSVENLMGLSHLLGTFKIVRDSDLILGLDK